MNRNAIIAAIVIALAAVGGVYLWQSLGSGPSQAEESACWRAECGWSGTVKIAIGTGYPPKCPKCGNNSALRLTTCAQCGHQQFHNLIAREYIPGKEDLPERMKCEKCNAPLPWS